MPTPQSQGGRARATALSARRRSAIARQAAKTRWSKPDPRLVLREKSALRAFCEKHDITELRAFGSILTRDFGPKSDVDLAYRGKLDFFSYCDALDELRALFGRKVDLVNLEVIEQGRNEHRCRHILQTAKVICRRPRR